MLVWPGLVYLTMTGLYVFCPEAGARITCKNRETGQIPLPIMALLSPYFLVMLGMWRLHHAQIDYKERENPFDKVYDTFYVGRYPMKKGNRLQFPAEVRNVVDLTAEFPARRSVTEGRTYHNVPALDMQKNASGFVFSF